MRRANHDKVSAPTIVPCPNCSAPMVPHRVCRPAGTTKGRPSSKSGSELKSARGRSSVLGLYRTLCVRHRAVTAPASLGMMWFNHFIPRLFDKLSASVMERRPRSRILRTGAYAPARDPHQQRPREDRRHLATSWIRERTGIRERRIAAEEETTSDMAAAAAALPWSWRTSSAADLDMIIVGTIIGRHADALLRACSCRRSSALRSDPVVRHLGGLRRLPLRALDRRSVHPHRRDASTCS